MYFVCLIVKMNYFSNVNYLKKCCFKYVKSLGISLKQFNTAFSQAIKQQAAYKQARYDRFNEIIHRANQPDCYVYVLACDVVTIGSVL